ncbi:MAG TPA: carbohydrate ABC transporter permease [Clostridia bacterium]
MDIKSKSRIAFEIANYTVLSIVAILCILPLLHVVAVSFSSSTPATAGYVKLWPVGFTLKTYEYVLKRVEFITALFVSLKRVAIGVPLNLFMILMTAYPLSKTKSEFHHRTFFSWFFILTIYISGGLIPLFMTVRYTGLIDTIWALVIPNAVSIFNVILVMSFIRITIPKDIEESAIVDGASYWRTLWQIIVPLSLPVIATVGLFVTVNHWNAWFDGIIYMNKPLHYPLQSYLRSIVIELDPSMSEFMDEELIKALSDKTAKCAQIVLAVIPVMLVYPFAQRYFITGITLGSVKE